MKARLVLCLVASVAAGEATTRALSWRLAHIRRGRTCRWSALSLRGGHEGADAEDSDESSCVWGWRPGEAGRSTVPGVAELVPRLDSEHAPWLDAYRQVYFESKLYNRTLLREREGSGLPPPPCARTINVSTDARTLSERSGAEELLCENWEQYWAEWDEAWAGPPDAGSDIAQMRYKMPYLPDGPPVASLSRISVVEKPIFTGRLFPDSIPRGWPEALADVLHDEYDEVTRVMDLNLKLLEAASAGDIETVAQLLREGALIHAGDSNNQYMTPLHHAAFRGHVELLYMLVQEEGAHLDRTTLGGETALHKAVQGRQPRAVEALLQMGADPNIRSGLSGCAAGRQPGMSWTPIFRAALFGLTDVVRMLVQAGAQVNAVGSVGWTPLHYAAAWAHNHTVAALLQFGADPLARTSPAGHTAYDRAMMARFAPDGPTRPTRQLYKSVIELLKEAMRRAQNGRDPVCRWATQKSPAARK
jgi:hypothetical protein